MNRVPELVVKTLVDSGITHVFVYPGGITIPIINALYDASNTINVVLARNEQTASAMANMYGRLTGKPGVLICQGPYGISTALFGINESALGSAPLVLITDITDFGVFHMHGVPQGASGEYGSLDAKGILKNVCKYVSAPITAIDCVQAVQQALKHATTGRPGPCAVILRSSNFTREVDENFLPHLFSYSAYKKAETTNASEETIAKIISIISEADRPAVIAGNGINVAKAYDELETFSHLFSLPVATSSMGKGVFDEDDPRSLGVIGSFGHSRANQFVGEADVVMVLGCRLKPPDTCYENQKLLDPNRQRIIHVDIDGGNINWTFPADISVVGDVKTILSQLINAKSKVETEFTSQSEWHDKIEQTKQHDDFAAAAAMEVQYPIHPKWLAGQLKKHVPADTIVTSDAGNNRFWMLRYFAAKKGCYHSPGGTLSVSFGIPAALGAQLVYPERPVLSVSGDGGFSMQIHALSTAVQYSLPVVFVVMNDSQLGMVREGQAEKPIGTEFVDTDYASIAKSFGCEGEKIEQPEDVAPSLVRAFESKRPYVLDIRISKEEKIYEQLFSPLARESFTMMTSKGEYYR